MEIPKIIERDEHIYIFEKKYPNCFLYKDLKTGVRECFLPFDIFKQKNEDKARPTNWERMDDK